MSEYYAKYAINMLEKENRRLKKKVIGHRLISGGLAVLVWKAGELLIAAAKKIGQLEGELKKETKDEHKED